MADGLRRGGEQVSGAAETLLADQFWLLAHDEITGRSHIGGHARRLGLAGAVLAELVLCDRLTVAGGVVQVLDGTDYGEPVTAAVVQVIAGNQAAGRLHPARTWVEYLGGREGARTDDAVTLRLRSNRLVRPLPAAGLRRAPRWVAADQQVGVRPAAGLSWAITHEQWPGQQAATLAGLALATGLGPMVRAYGDAKVIEDGLRWLVDRLPAELAAVVAGVEAGLVASAGAVR